MTLRHEDLQPLHDKLDRIIISLINLIDNRADDLQRIVALEHGAALHPTPFPRGAYVPPDIRAKLDTVDDIIDEKRNESLYWRRARWGAVGTILITILGAVITGCVTYAIMRAHP